MSGWTYFLSWLVGIVVLILITVLGFYLLGNKAQGWWALVLLLIAWTLAWAAAILLVRPS